MNQEPHPAKVSITYEPEVEPRGDRVELPFVIGVMADLAGDACGQLPALEDRRFVAVRAGSLDAVLARCAPRLMLAVDAIAVDLQFHTIADFAPEGLAGQVPGLEEALAAGAPGAFDRLDAILHSPAFQRLEARWRGLKYLLDSAGSSDIVQVVVLSVTKDELLADVRKGREGAIYQKICKEPYSVLRGNPFAVVVGDYEFSNESADLEILEGLARIGETAHAPFLAAPSPGMFGWTDFSEIPGRLGDLFETGAHARWHSFRGSDDSRYVALVLPRMLLRLPYGPFTFPVRAFPYQEDVGDDDHDRLLWCNSSYALAATLAEAFRKYHWCAAIRGIEGGGLVEFLPLHRHRRQWDSKVLMCSLEAMIDERAEKELSDNGFVVLLGCPDTPVAVFFAVASCHRSGLHTGEAATRAARLGSRLPHIMAVSRFAHYLKAIVRDRTEPPRSGEECAQWLNAWIGRYVRPEAANSPEEWSGRSAEFPLLSARIEVDEIPGSSGRFRATAWLRPSFQLEDPGAPLRIVVELP
jgi:type VI secretion system protein ImpC